MNIPSAFKEELYITPEECIDLPTVSVVSVICICAFVYLYRKHFNN